MRRIVEKYAGRPPHVLDYSVLLEETNVFGAGRDLVYERSACETLITLLSEVEAALDLWSAFGFLSGTPVDVASMKVSSELEFWAFFQNGNFSNVLWIGSGATPITAFYALQRLPELHITGLDLVPHCTVLCSQVAARLEFQERLHPLTGSARELGKETIEKYDGFFISSAVRPKNEIIELLLTFKQKNARIYAREDESHPYFYEPVTLGHPDVLTGRQARAFWLKEKGVPYPLPRGCEVGFARANEV